LVFEKYSDGSEELSERTIGMRHRRAERRTPPVIQESVENFIHLRVTRVVRSIISHHLSDGFIVDWWVVGEGVCSESEGLTVDV
jgi:hypothetical protein